MAISAVFVNVKCEENSDKISCNSFFVKREGVPPPKWI